MSGRTGGTGATGGRAGFTYAGLMVVIAVIGIMTAVVAQYWKVTMKAEREKQLLWIGHQYRRAIGIYYDAKEVPSHAQLQLYPAELKDLQMDPRSPAVHRYIRKLYPDPVTGKNDWVLVMDAAGRIRGIHSKSDKATLKRDNFDKEDAGFAGKTRYSEWLFEYMPEAQPSGQPQEQQQQQQEQQQQQQEQGADGP